MERIKEIAGLAAVTLLLSLLTWGPASSYLEEYNLFSADPTSVTVTEKTGTKGLFTPPSYYVRVILPNGKESQTLNRISKRQMMEIEKDDSLSGYSSGPSDFSTIHDIVIDSIFYLAGILTLGFFAFCCLVATVLSFPALDRLEQNRSYKRNVKRKRIKREKQEKEGKGWGIVSVILLFFLFFLGRFGWNLIRKLLPFGKTGTDAMIFDRYSDVTYRKYQDSIYELTVSFEDQAGHNIQVIKNVTRHTYQQYDIGDNCRSLSTMQILTMCLSMPLLSRTRSSWP
ncbi:hypothetical protein [Sporosarcina sp. SAFN-010]|uniref:hypothetical protein n=1 Tax=Sporosarcina sp. SAFN-010 TaxID=3387273 RepID=UPI003F800CB3